MNVESKVSMVAAMGRKREIGQNNKLLWNIPTDLQHFHNLTRGHPVIMGRKTHESIGRLLSNRTNIIVTRDPNYKVEGAAVVNSISDAIELAKQAEGAGEICIIGGSQIYEQGLPFADVLHLTLVDAEFPDADAFFPKYEDEFKEVISRESHEEDGLKFTFVDLIRQ